MTGHDSKKKIAFLEGELAIIKRDYYKNNILKRKCEMSGNRGTKVYGKRKTTYNRQLIKFYLDNDLDLFEISELIFTNYMDVYNYCYRNGLSVNKVCDVKLF